MIWRTISVWQDWSGNRNVPELNWNDSKRKLNLNWFDNDWNGNYRFAGVRNFLFFRQLAGVFWLVCLRQPPSILPTSSKDSAKRVYFLLSKYLCSQAICRKKFRRFNLDIDREIRTIFSPRSPEKLAWKISSRASVNRESIFAPRLYR
jgi:hypothetical protein